MKAPKVKGLSKKKKEEHILDDFNGTLPDFCASVLFNGERRGNSWICSDLQNSPNQAGSLGSCNIDLQLGVFCDHNPAASHQGGGMLDMWMAIFGVSKGEAIKGIKQWNKDHTLPDGSKGVVSGKRVEVNEDAIIEAQDDFEKDRVKWIGVFQEWKDFHSGICECSQGRVYPDEVERNEKQIAWAVSDIFSRRWMQISEATQVVREKFAEELAEMRGLSKEVFLWLIDNGYIAYFYERKETTQEQEPVEIEEDIWETPPPKVTVTEHTNILFPVYRETTPDEYIPDWAGGRQLIDRAPSLEDMGKPHPTIFFYGMHIPWTDWRGVKQWRYEPKGCTSYPYIIGDLKTADLVIIAESTWDIIAYIDLRKLYTWKRPWCAVATRGARNAQRIPASQIKQGAVVLRLLQNDAANAAWVSSLPAIPQAEHREITPPDGIKDLNDWMKAGADNVLKAIW
jgi:hypothetical protein